MAQSRKPNTTRYSTRQQNVQEQLVLSMSPPEKSSHLFNYGGCGGILTAEHYRILRELEEKKKNERARRQIAPRLGTQDYFDWMKRQGVTVDLSTLRSPVRAKSKS